MRPERITTESPIAESSPADQRTEGSLHRDGSARCEVTCGEYPGYYKCGRPAKYVTDGSKPPGPMLVCGIHKRGRAVKPIAPNAALFHPAEDAGGAHGNQSKKL